MIPGPSIQLKIKKNNANDYHFEKREKKKQWINSHLASLQTNQSSTWWITKSTIEERLKTLHTQVLVCQCQDKLAWDCTVSRLAAIAAVAATFQRPGPSEDLKKNEGGCYLFGMQVHGLAGWWMRLRGRHLKILNQLGRPPRILWYVHTYDESMPSKKSIADHLTLVASSGSQVSQCCLKRHQTS